MWIQVQPARTRVAEWVAEAAQNWNLRISGGAVGELNKGQRKEMNEEYFSSLRQAQIIVTCNPSNWEGDFRLWEAMGSGALVFIDEMSTPMPSPLLDGVHGESRTELLLPPGISSASRPCGAVTWVCLNSSLHDLGSLSSSLPGRICLICRSSVMLTCCHDVAMPVAVYNNSNKEAFMAKLRYAVDNAPHGPVVVIASQHARLCDAYFADAVTLLGPGGVAIEQTQLAGARDQEF